jgi:hypothetical protein
LRTLQPLARTVHESGEVVTAAARERLFTAKYAKDAKENLSGRSLAPLASLAVSALALSCMPLRE